MVSRPQRFASATVVVALAASLPDSATAQSSCDCTAIVDSCEAQVARVDATLEIRASATQCARVDYFVDGAPFVAVLSGNEPHRATLEQPAAEARVIVQGCQVCRTVAAAPVAATPAAPVERPLEALIEVAPEYPAAAQARGLDGEVEVSFTVDAEGTVTNATVVRADPSGVFEAAALAAVQRSRYPADPGRSPAQLTRTLRFEFDEYVWQLPRANVAESVPPASPASGCLRETARYDFGDAVEVGMLNACAEPMLVFGCAGGVRGEAGRWACSGSDESRSVLAARNDGRLGTQSIVATPAGSRSFELVDELYFLRAPNSQIWWIACRTDDLACLSRARQWVRSLDGQTASIDPRDRTDLALARAH